MLLSSWYRKFFGCYPVFKQFVFNFCTRVELSFKKGHCGSPVFLLYFSAHSGVVLSVEEVEAGLKGLKVDQEGKIAAPFMAEQMEESLNIAGSRQIKKDGDMTAFNKLVSSMKASGTLPSQPKVNVSNTQLSLVNC